MKEPRPLTKSEKRAIAMAKMAKQSQFEIDRFQGRRIDRIYDENCQIAKELFEQFFEESYDGEGYYLIPFTKKLTMERLDKILLIASNAYGIEISRLVEYDVIAHSELCVLIQ